MSRNQHVRSFCLVGLLALISGCMSAPQKAKLTEVEELYQQGQYQNAMSVARYNINNHENEPASIVVVWKVQVLQGTQSVEYVQALYNEAQSRVKEFGPTLVPFLCRGLQEDPYNTVRLFCMYAMSEFDDTTATRCVSQVLDPAYTLGAKPSDITLEFLQSEAAMVLGARKYTAAFDGIAKLAESKNLDTQNKVAQALGMLGDQRALPVLENLKKNIPPTREGKFLEEMADSSIARIQRGQ
ncbi:HEAT repeat domain-containing protein [bacterium]|nr:HEAT repeat domain-containing protein [bacterium]